MYLTCIIPNSIYLPDSEATPDLRRCSLPVDEETTPGITNIRNAIAFEYSEEGMGLHTVTYLLELLEEGIALFNGTTEDKIDETMCPPKSYDWLMRRWLKQAVAYSRVNLTDADEDNPTLECFVVTANSPSDWD